MTGPGCCLTLQAQYAVPCFGGGARECRTTEGGERLLIGVGVLLRALLHMLPTTWHAASRTCRQPSGPSLAV